MSYFNGKSVDFPSVEAFEHYQNNRLIPPQRALLTEWGERWRTMERDASKFPHEPGLEELVEAAWGAGRMELCEEECSHVPHLR